MRADSRTSGTVSAASSPPSDQVDLDQIYAAMSDEQKRAFADQLALTDAADLARLCRRHADLDQLGLQDRTGIPQSSISDIERRNGKLGASFTLLKRLVEGCGFNIEIRLSKKTSQTPTAVAIHFV